jgi:hypothetical protein
MFWYYIHDIYIDPLQFWGGVNVTHCPQIEFYHTIQQITRSNQSIGQPSPADSQTTADRSIAVATNHEQAGYDEHHGHLVHGHLVRGGFITNRSVQKGGTGRLLHLFG